MSNTRLRAADLADEFRSISSDKRMEYVPARANHLLIAADMLDANDELLMRLNSEYRVRQNIAAENAKLRELVARMAHVLRADDEWTDPFYCNPYCADQFRCRSDDCVEVQCPIVKNMRELGVEV